MGVAGLRWGCWDGVSCGCGWKQSRGGITLRQRTGSVRGAGPAARLGRARGAELGEEAA